MILCMRLVKERWCYKVTWRLIGRTHTQIGLWLSVFNTKYRYNPYDFRDVVSLKYTIWNTLNTMNGVKI